MSAHAAVLAAVPLDIRVKRGANPATPAADLLALAHDPAVTVRGAVALNPSNPAATDLQLAADPDERVRLLLARKVAALLPRLAHADPDGLRARAEEVLATLVRDEADRVRTAIAQVAAGLADLPHGLILALARDACVSVSEPVLRLSPLLSADDLLALMQAPPHAAAPAAIAQRTNLPPAVTDAIAASADSAAIRTMLANPSAAIREDTLDALVARASLEPDWHHPLVNRPVLPDRAARALSEIVATHLLRALADRGDLPADTLADIKRRLPVALADGATPAQPGNAPAGDALEAELRQLNAAGKLDEAALCHALRAGEHRRAAAMLAWAAGVKPQTVDHAVALRSAKALVSLVWKAGFPMRLAGPVQALLGGLAPACILAPTPGGGFPLREEEMTWQLGFVGARANEG